MHRETHARDGHQLFIEDPLDDVIARNRKTDQKQRGARSKAKRGAADPLRHKGCADDGATQPHDHAQYSVTHDCIREEPVLPTRRAADCNHGGFGKAYDGPSPGSAKAACDHAPSDGSGTHSCPKPTPLRNIAPPHRPALFPGGSIASLPARPRHAGLSHPLAPATTPTRVQEDVAARRPVSGAATAPSTPSRGHGHSWGFR